MAGSTSGHGSCIGSAAFSVHRLRDEQHDLRKYHEQHQADDHREPEGQDALEIVLMGTSWAMPLTTNTFMPTGGVIIPISISMTAMTPNQIGSKPSDIMIG